MAKLYFFTEARYFKYGNHYYNPSGVLKYDLFKRYLGVFDELIVVARVLEVFESEFSVDLNRVDGERISVYELPYFHGVASYLLNRRKLNNELKSIVSLIGNKDRCLLRVPGNVGELAASILLKNKISYYLEVVGDPMDVFSKGANNHPFRFIFKILLTSSLKKTVINANGVCYITSYALPVRYPCKKDSFSTIISNVQLTQNDFVEKIDSIDISNSINLISIGSLEQMYKGPDIVLRAMHLLVKENIDVNLLWLGEGRYKEDMIALSKDLGIHNRCCFIGFVNDKTQINKLLDRSDVFVLASRAEAQGRVIIEAMARGKIIIGTDIGGIPENVPAQFLIPKDDIDALRAKILEIKDLNDLDYWQNINLRRSKDYCGSILEAKREIFLRKILKDEREDI
ncbi:MAG: glycosyltransferase [Mesonia sp.]|uniref:glycosyltransferase n=1 Tax=Mesonia sp. TaxID=1960830 RepID=UPI003F9CA47C